MPFLLIRILWRSRHQSDYGKRLGERFGWGSLQLNQCIWIHAVSLGETLASIDLIKLLLETHPHLPILITNMTPTGSHIVKKILGDSVKNAYIPYDLPGAMARFIKKVNPALLIIMETELWPNLLHHCHKNQIPVVIANARLSEKSAAGYQRISWLTRHFIPAVHLIAAQSEADVKRFRSLGFPEDILFITGSLKFDIVLPDELTFQCGHLRDQLQQDRFIWIAGSTHPGEEEIILSAHRRILKIYPSALLILVPRHPERTQAILPLIKKTGMTVVRRSENPLPLEANVYLVDTLGELLLFYSISDIVFIGGSLIPQGGHNMLEPAALKKPLLTGPFLHNFQAISQLLLNAEAIIIVKTAETLTEHLIQLFANPAYRQSQGLNAFHVVERNKGALQKLFALIDRHFLQNIS